MTPKQFQQFLERDGHCLHCGITDDTLIPQHRANRGHGGYKAGNAPANIIVMCSLYNGLIESNAILALEAEQNGWKISRYDEPTEKPVYDVANSTWWTLDNSFARTHSV